MNLNVLNILRFKELTFNVKDIFFSINFKVPFVRFLYKTDTKYNFTIETVIRIMLILLLLFKKVMKNKYVWFFVSIFRIL